MEERFNSDVSKELLTMLSYCDNSLISNIPENVIENLTESAADSNKEYFVNKNKSLMEQNISSECKKLIALLYFTYMTNDEEKEELLNTWLKNEKESKNS